MVKAAATYAGSNLSNMFHLVGCSVKILLPVEISSWVGKWGDRVKSNTMNNFTYSLLSAQKRVVYRKFASWDPPKWVKTLHEREKERYSGDYGWSRRPRLNDGPPKEFAKMFFKGLPKHKHKTEVQRRSLGQKRLTKFGLHHHIHTPPHTNTVTSGFGDVR